MVTHAFPVVIIAYPVPLNFTTHAMNVLKDSTNRMRSA